MTVLVACGSNQDNTLNSQQESPALTACACQWRRVELSKDMGEAQTQIEKSKVLDKQIALEKECSIFKKEDYFNCDVQIINMEESHDTELTACDCFELEIQQLNQLVKAEGNEEKINSLLLQNEAFNSQCSKYSAEEKADCAQ